MFYSSNTNYKSYIYIYCISDSLLEQIVFDRQSIDMILQIVRKSAEASIRAEETANAALAICEKNQSILVEINDRVLHLTKASQDSWWQVIKF